MVRAINTPDFRKNLQSQGADPVGNSPEQYLLFIQNETDKWAKVIKSAGIKVE
jgi:tripartite-type tricarboxylate transporter receptor subunit TctC